MFYDRFAAMCRERKVTPTAAVRAMGLSNSLAAKWKRTGATPQGETLQKIADYFSVSVDRLLGQEERAVTEEELRLALFGGDAEVTDEMWNEAVFAVQLIKERHKREMEK